MASPPQIPIIKLVKSKDGLEIYAEAVGDPSKPHVVFIHGLALSGIVWDAQFSSPELFERLYIVRYDLRGHGRTEKPLDLTAWTSQQFAEDFDAVINAFNLKRPVLAGWSYGSTPALDILTTFGPSYLSGIIYIGALPYTTATHIVTAWQSETLGKLLAQSSSESELDSHRQDFVDGCFADPSSIPPEKRRAWVAAMRVQPRAVLRRVLRREQHVARLWNEGTLEIPLLVIHGQQDRICDHNALIVEANSRFENVQVESWKGVGHAPFEERVQQFNDTVIRWVEAINSQGMKAHL